jgi:hypothetical protein
MQAPHIEVNPAGLPLPELFGAFGRFCARARVQAHTLAVPALASVLMQGLVC